MTETPICPAGSIVKEVYARPLIVPYPTVRKFGQHAISQGEHVLVRLVTDQGVEGLGEAISRPYVYGESIPSIMHALKEWMLPTLIGASVFDVRALSQKWSAFAGNYVAKAAVDMALVDIQARLLGIPLWRLHGGVDPVIPLAWILTYGSVEETVDEAKLRVAQGYRWFKIKVSADARVDRALLEALRKALPADCRFYADANGTIPRGTVLSRLNELHALGVEFIEDPIDVQDLAAKRELRAAGPMPIMADESAKSLKECGQEILVGGADMFSVKIFRTGLTMSHDIATFAVGMNRLCMVGGQGETQLGAAIAAHFASGARARGCAPFPAEISSSYRYDFSVLASGPRLENGRLLLSDQPGLGAALDGDVIGRLSRGTDDPKQPWIRL